MKKFLLLFVLLAIVIFEADAQKIRQVTGKVTDKANKESIPGVSISIKGTAIVVSTDDKGQFKISVPDQGETILMARYIGYVPQEIAVGNQSKVNFILQEDVSQLNEVMINIGYGTVKKEMLTGSVSVLSGKDVADFPVGTLAQALAGKMAGLSVTTPEGNPGADIQVKVRGGSSLTGDNAPLYIVDGIPVENALSILSPGEIESINLLKDVASTAIYGSRGSNGVMIITTKIGKPGKTMVSFDVFGGARQIVNKLEVMDPYNFVKYQYELYNNNTSQQVKDDFTKAYGTYEDLDIYKNIEKVDWQDKVFGRQAWSSTQVLNISGGTDKTTFNFSLNNTKEEGIMLESGYRRTFASFRFDHKISDKLRFGLNARYSRQRVDGIGTSSTQSQSANRLRNAVRYLPYLGGGDSGDLFDADFLATQLTNPISLAHNELKADYRNDLISSAYVSFQILKNLSLKSTLGMNFNDRNVDIFNGLLTGVARNNANMPAIQLDNSNTTSFINTNTLTYRPDLGKNHSLELLAGQELRRDDVNSNSMTIKWFPANISPEEAFANIQKTDLPNGAVQDKPTSAVAGTRNLSVFARAAYAYKGKYLATFNFRRDGISVFAPENRYGNFPSAQIAWRTSEEEFFKQANIKWFNSLKLRVSYGAAGNSRIGQDLFRTVFLASSTAGGYAVNDASVSTGLISNKLANPKIKWETNMSANFGMDMEFFDSRLTATVDLYQNRTKNLLLDANISTISGYPTQQQNVGKTQNRGLELQLGLLAVKSRNFTYNTSFNISFNQNKILELQNGVNAYLTQSGWVNSLADVKVEVGKPVGQFYGYISDGRYTVNDFNYVQNTNTGAYTYTLKSDVPNSRSLIGNREPQPGDMKVRKLSSSESMVITEDDRTVLGNAQPKFIGGFNNQFTYKNFDMSVFLNFSVGNKVYNANTLEFTSQFNVKDNNLLNIMTDRWQNFDAKGIKVTDPAMLSAMNENTTYWTPTPGNYALTSFAVEDGSFLRITNVTLGYTLPQSLLKRSGFISKLRVYGTVNNLLTITGYSGYDPEANTRRNNPLTPGIDYAAYPRSRYILAGLNLVF
ncbi:TonB-dependent receptor [Pedobacter gandavensis]|uniref:SusC/RagA family TonB-linked outer membrane protein n=1 Tax=Pedobacter gandavensis TaxID=2679963 RepID=UPI00247944A3|nr:TonB-dependent receptor [Pedobacter gandavensis]WGQ10360.1 TonB-dependent receptor [Pedobacter gandavensis]